jgi:hypothetical protein
MRINAITNWAYAVTVVLTALSGGAFILSTNSANEERLAVEEHLAFDTLAEELALGAEERTDEARLYVMQHLPRSSRMPRRWTRSRPPQSRRIATATGRRHSRRSLVLNTNACRRTCLIVSGASAI